MLLLDCQNKTIQTLSPKTNIFTSSQISSHFVQKKFMNFARQRNSNPKQKRKIVNNQNLPQPGVQAVDYFEQNISSCAGNFWFAFLGKMSAS